MEWEKIGQQLLTVAVLVAAVWFALFLLVILPGSHRETLVSAKKSNHSTWRCHLIALREVFTLAFILLLLPLLILGIFCGPKEFGKLFVYLLIGWMVICKLWEWKQAAKMRRLQLEKTLKEHSDNIPRLAKRINALEEHEACFAPARSLNPINLLPSTTCVAGCTLAEYKRYLPNLSFRITKKT